MAWRKKNGSSVTIDDVHANPNPSESDRFVANLLIQINGNYFAPLTSALDDTPLTEQRHRLEGIEFWFDRPVDWLVQYEPDYSVHSASATEWVDEQGNHFRSPHLSVMVGRSADGTGAERFDHYLKGLQAPYSASDKFAITSRAEIDHSDGVYRFEYSYECFLAGRHWNNMHWKAVATYAVRTGGPFVRLRGLCFRSDWSQWQPLLTRCTGSLRALAGKAV
jgi:hypothetical protein